ncbi:MAG: acyl-CoA dehydrogenase [Pseudomonadota bacterium]|nr:acyl-CoA dehydrogenase [Pseudomonadota bacterium]
MYTAPLRDMRFVLDHIIGWQKFREFPAFRDLAPETVEAILSEAGKLAADVLAPLNLPGDRQGARVENGQVRMPDGFRDAYHHYVQGGWNSLPFDPQYGGQGLPWFLALMVQEMWQAANTSFSLCPMLNQGAVELLSAHGTEEQKKLFLPRLVSGEWTGTMNLTESQAGSDVGAVRARAMPEGDHYRITGQKIYITYGDHDMAGNVIHMVLARTGDAPPGTKGLSLFLVPKILVHPDGTLGGRNDVELISIEHKLGIHASPTATLSFGDRTGALGWLVGSLNGGMACMFTMMNNARLSVGSQGVALAERAYQQAREYARTRLQGRGSRSDAPVTIIHHPDVRRMLLVMKAHVEAGRALAAVTAAALDTARHHPEETARQKAQARADLLTPVAKAWCTDMAVDITSIGIQVHGGMGYIEETGAAQHWRDSRITPIYEGTNGIQASDLVFRKVVRDRGAAVEALLGEIHAFMKDMTVLPGDDLAVMAEELAEAITAFEDSTAWILKMAGERPDSVAACAVLFLKLAGTVIGGWLLARGAVAATLLMRESGGDAAFYEAKILTARFYAEHILPQVLGLVSAIQSGSLPVMGMGEEQF